MFLEIEKMKFVFSIPHDNRRLPIPLSTNLFSHQSFKKLFVID